MDGKTLEEKLQFIEDYKKAKGITNLDDLIENND